MSTMRISDELRSALERETGRATHYAFRDIASSIQGEGDRQRLRGYLHSMLGRPSFAAGSYLKMVKKYRKADDIRERHRMTPMEARICKMFMDDLARVVGLEP